MISEFELYQENQQNCKHESTNNNNNKCKTLKFNHQDNKSIQIHFIKIHYCILIKWQIGK
jgi:hypothetical protein